MYIYIVLDRDAKAYYIFSFFDDVIVGKHWFETKRFNDKQALANHRQKLVMWLKSTQALTLWQSKV